MQTSQTQTQQKAQLQIAKKSLPISENISENESNENVKKIVNQQQVVQSFQHVNQVVKDSKNQDDLSAKNKNTQALLLESDEPHLNTISIQVHFVGRNVPERLPNEGALLNNDQQKSHHKEKDTLNPTFESEGPKQLDGDIYSDNSSLRDEDQKQKESAQITNNSTISISEEESKTGIPRDSFASSARGSIPNDDDATMKQIPNFTNILPDFARGSTIKKVFEEIKLNIATHSFHDLEQRLRSRRNLDIAHLLKQFKGEALDKQQQFTAKIQFKIEDSFGLLDQSQSDVVYDSQKVTTNPRDSQTVTIKEKLRSQHLLEQTMLDKYLEIRCEVRIEPLKKNIKSAGTEEINRLDSLKSQFTLKLGEAQLQPRRTNIMSSGGPDAFSENSSSGVYLSGQAEIGNVFDNQAVHFRGDQEATTKSGSLPGRRSTFQASKLRQESRGSGGEEHLKALQYISENKNRKTTVDDPSTISSLSAAAADVPDLDEQINFAQNVTNSHHSSINEQDSSEIIGQKQLLMEGRQSGSLDSHQMQKNDEKVRNYPALYMDDLDAESDFHGDGVYHEKATLRIVEDREYGGFRVISSSTGKDLFVVSWTEHEDLKMTLEGQVVVLGGPRNAKIRILDKQDFLNFQSAYQFFSSAVDFDPFSAFPSSIVSRPSAKMTREMRSQTQILRDKDLESQSFLIFGVQKEKQTFLMGNVWRKHHMTLEMLQEQNLWQVEIKSLESQEMGKNPEEIFLLQAVDHIIVGQDQRMKCNQTSQNMTTSTTSFGQKNQTNQQSNVIANAFISKIQTGIKNQAINQASAAEQSQTSTKNENEAIFVKFVFRQKQIPVHVVFEDYGESQQFLKKIRMIAAKKWNIEPNSFIVRQNSHIEASEKLRNTVTHYPWLTSEKDLLVDKISSAMRQKHSSVSFQEDFNTENVDQTQVEWKTQAPSGLQTKQITPRIRFKCLIYLNSEQKECYIEGAPQVDKEGDFLYKPAQFSVFQSREDGREVLIDQFMQEDIQRFQLSLMDNRMIQMALQNEAEQRFDEVTLIFTSVFKRNQFIELVNLSEPILSSNVQNKGENRVIKVGNFDHKRMTIGDCQNLKVFSMTWNLGQSDSQTLFSRPDKIFPDIDQFDLVILCGQECKRQLKNARIIAIEQFMQFSGFINLDTQFVSMWEMFLICFVKKDLLPHISKVKQAINAKGKNLLVSTVGNKGGIAYSFMLKNRLFNIIACHLQHKQEKQIQRNNMAQELIREIKLQSVQQKHEGLESDSIGAFNFFMGDLNYRLKTTFTDLNNTNVKQKAVSMIPQSDQLLEAMREEGLYPDYVEPEIDFLPSYKMSTSQLEYVNKRDQAPSYCDRILFKNNSTLQTDTLFYRCQHKVFGSDHRPVQLGLCIRGFSQPKLANIDRILDRSKSNRLGAGTLNIEMVNLLDLQLNKVKALQKFATLFQSQTQAVQIRVTFHEPSICSISSPVNFSDQIQIMLNQNPKTSYTTWSSASLPILKTALNSPNLIKNSTLKMLVWLSDHPLFNGTEILIGHVNIKLDALEEVKGQQGTFVHLGDHKICASNKQVGQAQLKIVYTSPNN